MTKTHNRAEVQLRALFGDAKPDYKYVPVRRTAMSAGAGLTLPEGDAEDRTGSRVVDAK